MCAKQNVTKNLVKRTRLQQKSTNFVRKPGEFPLGHWDPHPLRGTWVGFHVENSPLKPQNSLKSHPTSGVFKVPLSAGTTSGFISRVKLGQKRQFSLFQLKNSTFHQKQPKTPKKNLIWQLSPTHFFSRIKKPHPTVHSPASPAPLPKPKT